MGLIDCEKMIKENIEKEINGSIASVKIIEGYLLVEVICPSFTVEQSSDNQKAVFNAIKNTKALKNCSYLIRKIFTYEDEEKAFNTVGHLLTAPSGIERGLFTITLNANDAYVNIRDFDANVLQFSSRSRSSDFEQTMTLKSTPITAGGLSQFQIKEHQNYVELEMLGQIYVVSNTKKEPQFWSITVTRIGYELPVDGYGVTGPQG